MTMAFNRECVSCEKLIMPGEDFAVLEDGGLKCMGCYDD